MRALGGRALEAGAVNSTVQACRNAQREMRWEGKCDDFVSASEYDNSVVFIVDWILPEHVAVEVRSHEEIREEIESGRTRQTVHLRHEDEVQELHEKQIQ